MAFLFAIAVLPASYYRVTHAWKQMEMQEGAFVAFQVFVFISSGSFSGEQIEWLWAETRDKKTKDGGLVVDGRQADTSHVIVFGNMTYFARLFAKTGCGRRKGRRKKCVGVAVKGFGWPVGAEEANFFPALKPPLQQPCTFKTFFFFFEPPILNWPPWLLGLLLQAHLHTMFYNLIYSVIVMQA